MLELRNISKRYGTTTALDNISFELQPNEIFVLLGPTGAGKSSTLQCVAGLESVQTGQVLFNAQDITDQHPMVRDMSMVFEGYNLFSTLNVHDNIAFPLRSAIYRQSEDEIRRRVARVAHDLHIDHLLERDVETLSGGERQRVAIARAIVRQPALYLLDEPLSALDLKLREELRLELRRLHERHAATMLYATHDYHGAAAIADRIGILEHGQLYQVGTLNELYRDPQHVRVGALLGSPCMAFFPARRDGNTLRLGEYTSLALTELPGALPQTLPEHLLLGVWPDDIELSLNEAQGFQAGHIYAVDFRGTDRAVQVQHGEQYFRKVVDIDFPARQGDPCWFRFTPRQVYLFDAGSGARLGHTTT